jgi:hypothetical protein
MNSQNPEIIELDKRIETARLQFQKALSDKWRLTGREPIQGAPYLPAESLEGAELLVRREEALKKLRGCGKIMEVGTWQGTFARSMWELMSPDELHIVDIDFSRFDHAYFKPWIGEKVFLHQGNSADVLPTFEDSSFDLIYVDGDHGYQGASADIENALRKVKTGGYVGVNDYTTWCANLAMEFGVMTATNESIIRNKLRVRYFALHDNGNHDIFLQKV